MQNNNAHYHYGLGGFPPIEAFDAFPRVARAPPPLHPPPSIEAGLNEFQATEDNEASLQQGNGDDADAIQEGIEAAGDPNATKKAKRKEANADYYAKIHGPPLGADNTNRKSLDMPPVVGSTIQYNNKHLKYNPMPDDIDAVREKLFKAEKSMLLDSQQIADYWPHMNNVWQRSTKPFVEANGCVSEVWGCRNSRRITLAGKRKSGTGIRNRADKTDIIAETEQCKIRIKLTFFTKHAENPKDACGPPGFGNCKCIPDWLFIERSQPSKTYKHTHGHEIEMCDKYKRSDAIMYFAKQKVEECYSYSTVQKWLVDKYGTKAGMNHITKSDIANVARFWRMLNKDVELRGVIEEETADEKQRKQHFDSINTTSADRLARALTEVCRQIPGALDIAAPFLQQAEASTDAPPPILECDHYKELAIPEPGMPLPKEVVHAYKRPSPPRDPLQKYNPHYNGATNGPQQGVSQAGPSQGAPQNSNGAPSHALPNGHPAHTSPPRPPNHFNPPQVFVPQPQPQPGPSNSSVRSTDDAMMATISDPDPDAASRALLNTKPAEGFVQPYGASGQRPPQTTPQTTSYTTPWPPPSVTHPARQAAVPAINGARNWRPSWAVVESKKRHAPGASSDEPAQKRTLVDDISAQLRSELQSSA